MSPLIAIVGRPNVGKSALFNRVVGRRIAIVHDRPGVTRDRVAAEAEWRGRPFTLVDTGGIGLLKGEKADDPITEAAFVQVTLAIEAASVIIFVVDVQHGVAPLDREVAAQLRASGKPVIVAVNKVDNYTIDADTVAFAELGFEKLFPVSAIHGYGISALVDAATDLLPPAPEATPEDPKSAPLKLALIGRPNVGKSSIINALTQSERVIVSPVPGTTRDSVDVPFQVETEGRLEDYVLIDTAGMRKEKSLADSIEFFSVKRTENSIARCDIALMVLDAQAGLTALDKKIAGKIIEEKKACVVLVNKWDLFEEEVRENRDEARSRSDDAPSNLADFGRWVQEKLFFLDYAPVIFTSAKTGFHLDHLLEAIRYLASQLQQTVPTALLNRALNHAIEQRQPTSALGHRLKFFYATQVRQAPPTFVLFVNRDELFSPQYEKYLAAQLRKAFGFEGCPLILLPRARPKTIEPIRKYRTQKPKRNNERPAESRKPKSGSGGRSPQKRRGGPAKKRR